MRRVLVLAAGALGLAACEQATKCEIPAGGVAPTPVAAAAPQPCAAPVETAVGFTGAGPRDKLIVEALGPDCANPAMFARLIDGNGRLVYAEMTSGKWLMSAEMFPPGEGTAAGVARSLYDIGEPNSLTLPVWRAGASSPERGSYGAYEVLVPQPAYERLRALNAPMLIKRGGAESGTFFIYDPENGEAVAVAKFAV
jgi:hypothetical protein